jgi:decaprenylphospho-beta-D-ribofuranose 2-oxidase
MPTELAEAPTGTPELLSGWVAKSPASRAQVHSVADERQIDRLLAVGAPRGLIARGAGHSFGDAAQRAGGNVLRTTGLDRILEFDGAAGVVRAQSGASIGDLMRVSVPEGWLPAVLPTTRFVTVGGAIAADIHGRNQHGDGNFADHIDSLRIHTPQGAITASPEQNEDLFWATVGGMGLTGVIVEATMRLIPIESTLMRVWGRRAADLDDLMAQLADPGSASRYSVAWLDPLAQGASFGRGVIVRAEHAKAGEVSGDGAGRMEFAPVRGVRLPRRLPGVLRGRRTQAMNELLYRRAAAEARERCQSLGEFFHVHDRIDSWYSLSGPSGFVEYQFVVPSHRGELIGEAIARLAGQGFEPFFSVLKLFGRRTAGLLSFPMPGWMMALDLAAGPGLSTALAGLDEMVAAAGGRVYLAKDARMRPEAVAAMYPELDALRAVRERHDPQGLVRSDLSVRLEI